MKKVVFICACVAAVITLCAICFNRASSLEGLAKANVEAMASLPDNPDCYSGGIGSNHCSYSKSEGDSIIIACDVTCTSGYFACCSERGCVCVSYIN